MQKVLNEGWSVALQEKATPKVKICIDTSAGDDLLSPLCKYVQETFSLGWETEHKCIPLFVTPVPSARKSGGLNIPSELILDALDLSSLPTRIRQLQLVHAGGIDRAFLRAMCVGAFRKYLFLDDENHGQGEMDFSELNNLNARSLDQWTNKDGRPWPTVVMERIHGIIADEMASTEPRSLQAECFRLLFFENALAINLLMQCIRLHIDSPSEEIQS
jgi:hypothetical protein